MSDEDLAGDPPCWAHLFEDDDEVETASSDDVTDSGAACDPNSTDG